MLHIACRGLSADLCVGLCARASGDYVEANVRMRSEFGVILVSEGRRCFNGHYFGECSVLFPLWHFDFGGGVS